MSVDFGSFFFGYFLRVEGPKILHLTSMLLSLCWLLYKIGWSLLSNMHLLTFCFHSTGCFLY